MHNDTLMRQWQMMRLIPRFPSKISTTQLLHDLESEGYSASQRSIQRDLQKLSAKFPLQVDERDKPFGWSWEKDAALDVSGMEAHTALTFHLVEQHIQSILPKATVQKLLPYFKQAERMLTTETYTWADKVRVLSQGSHLHTPEVCSEVQAEVYEALRLSRRLNVTYLARGKKEAKNYEISPLGLVLKNSIFYLVCQVRHYEDYRLLTLHRMQAATKLDQPFSKPEGFDLDDYIASGELSFSVGSEIMLKANISKHVASHIAECKLDEEQSITDLDDGRFLLEAKVLPTSEFKWWLGSFGDGVEVLEPLELREHFTQQAENMLARYR